MKQFESFGRSYGLDTSNECLWRNDVQIELPPKPFAVLRYLVENPGRLVTHDELLDALWPETYVQPQVLRTYMLELRKVLEDDAKQPRFIQTLPKRGYRFVAPVTDRAPGAAQQDPSPIAKNTGIVDRVEELSRLQSHAQRTAGGQRQVVFVAGETGIGKTALVDAFCRAVAPALPASVARGQCVQGFSRNEAYYPVMEALGHLCASPDGEMACRILARMAPAWLAALGRAPADSTAERSAPHQRTLADLCGALEELAAEKALILLFEDLHWADDSTLDLISALARRRAQARLMVLATYRPHHTATQQRLKELKQDLLLRRLCAEIELAPLGKNALRQLLARELRQESLPAELAEFVHRHSEGNPLFAIAVVEHLIAQGILAREGANGAAQWQQRVPLQEMEAVVPGELAQMIELEIERLSQDERRLLEAASLMSVAFPAWAVAAALEEDTAETEEKCDELVRRLHFVNRAGEDELPDGTRSAFYVFAHELYREVLYRRQTAARRARRHIRIAERLGSMFAGREADVAREMAMHYEAAGGWLHAARALVAAAGHARRRQAHSETEELLQHALRLADNLGEPERETALHEIRNELAELREPSISASSQQRKFRQKA